jgi:predicted MFS family arabinose efflux permease
MHVPAQRAAAVEWRDNWPLTLAAMVGYSIIGLQSYAFGPFVSALEHEFGWTRAQAMLGVSVSNGVGVFLNILIGMIVDRLGPRRVGLTGLFVKGGSFALLATATGSLLNWSLLWGVLAVGVVLVQSTVWTKAVAARFDRSRGIAMAVVLSGTPITAMIAPLLGTWLIGNYGWRAGFVGVGLSWVIVSFPIVFFLFRDGKGEGKAGVPASTALRDHPGLTLREGIRTRAFFCLMISFGAFSFYNMSIATNLVPLLRETGISAMKAAGIASIMGLTGIVARVLVGFLLDRLPGNIIGMVCQSLPVFGCAILLLDAPGSLLLSLAVAFFGIATGAEMDAALYLATRHFGLKAFASLFGAIITFGAVNAAIGPYVAGLLHDSSGSYDPLLMAIMVVMTVGAIAIGSIGRPKHSWPGGGGH